MNLVESEKLQKMLFVYLFIKDEQIDLNVYWKCGHSKTKNCNARAITKGGDNHAAEQTIRTKDGIAALSTKKMLTIGIYGNL